MDSPLTDTLKSEWKVLHGDHERYEQFALVIKLFTVATMLSCWIFNVEAVLTVGLILVLWLQEAIWKTFQARIGTRLLQVEDMLRKPGYTESAAFQLYSTWSSQSKRTVAMLTEYISHVIRPTVAYPYIVFVSIVVTAEYFPGAPV